MSMRRHGCVCPSQACSEGTKMRNSQGRIYARYCQVFQSFLARCLHPARGRGGAVCGLQALADSRGAASGAGAAGSAAAAVARRQYVPSAVVAVLRDPGSAARDSAGPGRGTIQSAAGSHAISKYRSGLSALATLAIHRARAMHSQHRWLLAARARTAARLCRCIGDTGCAVGQDAGIGGLRRLPQSVTATVDTPLPELPRMPLSMTASGLDFVQGRTTQACPASAPMRRLAVC